MTLSDIASTLITVELPCEDCDGTGQQDAQQTNVISLFDPYEFVRRTCGTCKGDGVRLVELCALCEQEEGICSRVCRRAVCCGKDPGECDCPDGLELYRAAYGLPKVA